MQKAFAHLHPTVWLNPIRQQILTVGKRTLLIGLAICSLAITVWLHPAQGQATPANPSTIAQRLDPQFIGDGFANAEEAYHAGQYRQAVEQWLQMIQDLAAAGESQRLNQAMALSNLSLTYQALGEWEQAKASLDQALILLEIDPIAESLRPASDNPDYLRVLAQSVNIRGKLHYLTGQIEAALADWQHIQPLYQRIGHIEGEIGSILNQAQAYQALGQYLSARNHLEAVKNYLNDDTLKSTLDIILQITLWQNLATTERLMGELDRAFEHLEQAEQLTLRQDTAVRAKLTLEKGNIQQAIAIRKRDLGLEGQIAEPTLQALSAYQSARIFAQNAGVSVAGLTELQATLSQLKIQIQFGQWLDSPDVRLTPAPDLLAAIDGLLRNPDIPVSRQKLYAQIGFAESLMAVVFPQNPNTPPPGLSSGQITEILGAEILGAEILGANILGNATHQKQNLSDEQVVASRVMAELLGDAAYQARERLQDERTESYAMGRLGELYGYTEQSEAGLELAQLVEAKDLTQQAILLSNQAQAPDIRYQWLRQMGQFLEAEGQREDALQSYRAAVEDLRQVRTDLLAVNSEVQFSFRDNVEPIYRGFIELLIKTADSKIGTEKKQSITEALESFDELQLAEINNFLGCNSQREIKLELVKDQQAGIVYAITLKDQIAVILDMPNGENPDNRKNILITEEIPLKKQNIDLIEKIREFREFSEDSFKEREAKELSKQLYTWLFQPIKYQLDQEVSLETLVFVLDGDLRNISLAALSDENDEYLIEKYSLAVTPGIDLFEPRELPDKLEILLGGIQRSQSDVEGIRVPAIPRLERELSQIQSLAHTYKSFTEENFMSDKIREALSGTDYSVVHFKTHGQFSSDPEKTFIAAFEELIRGRDLGNLIQSGNINENQFIDLLTLSACETAQGDNRAVLGITGIAVRAGARSVVSSLWKADNLRTIEVMSAFYSSLFSTENTNNTQRTRAEALRSAQLDLLKNGAQLKDWAPYVLVGNWR